MITIKKKRGEQCVCPHCDYVYDEPVEDFIVVALMVGDTECDNCDKVFTVQQTDSDDFEIYNRKE